MCCSADIFLGVIAILFPPLPVWVKCGICSADSIINILLCTLGYFPGLLHSWYIIAKFPEPAIYYQQLEHSEGGNAAVYVYVQGPQNNDPRRPLQQQPPVPSGMNYGTASASPPAAPASSAPASASQQQPPQPPSNNAGEGRSTGPPPPSYAQVVAGDNKVQSQE